METNKKKNSGVKMTKADVKALIDAKKERLAKQQERLEKLQQTIENTSNDIEQLEYTLTQMERAETKPRHVVPHERVAAFFVMACLLMERLQHRLHRTLNYAWFCLALCSRYAFRSRSHDSAHALLSPGTVLGYFKRERGMAL